MHGHDSFEFASLFSLEKMHGKLLYALFRERRFPRNGGLAGTGPCIQILERYPSRSLSGMPALDEAAVAFRTCGRAVGWLYDCGRFGRAAATPRK